MLKGIYNRLFCLFNGLRRCPCCGSWRIRIKEKMRYGYEQYEREYRIICKTCRHQLTNSMRNESEVEIKKMWNKGRWKLENTIGGNGWTFENKGLKRRQFKAPDNLYFRQFQRDMRYKVRKEAIRFWVFWTLVALIITYVLYYNKIFVL